MIRALFVLVLLSDAPPSGEPKCAPKWVVKASNCEYTLGVSKGAQRGDVVTDPMEATYVVGCGERVKVCGAVRLCKCKSGRDGGL